MRGLIHSGPGSDPQSVTASCSSSGSFLPSWEAGLSGLQSDASRRGLSDSPLSGVAGQATAGAEGMAGGFVYQPGGGVGSVGNGSRKTLRLKSGMSVRPVR